MGNSFEGPVLPERGNIYISREGNLDDQTVEYTLITECGNIPIFPNAVGAEKKSRMSMSKQARVSEHEASLEEYGEQVGGKRFILIDFGRSHKRYQIISLSRGP